MKKLILLFTMMIAVNLVQAQQGSAEQKSALRTVLDIEKKMLADNSDTTAVRLINDHKKSKTEVRGRLSRSDGYSKIKKDKVSIEKFKVKAVKKDARLATLDQKEQAAKKTKQDYISSVNPRYKEVLPIAYP